ncbi:MAG: hypothetical protein KF852_00565 [Saprospiraceae bacterium]|nr:hypothetical protein [Saprospiraceae bacterium]
MMWKWRAACPALYRGAKVAFFYVIARLQCKRKKPIFDALITAFLFLYAFQHGQTPSAHPFFRAQQHCHCPFGNRSRQALFRRYPVGYRFDNIFLTPTGLRLIDVGISALRTQVGERLFERFVHQELQELETFRQFFLSR